MVRFKKVTITVTILLILILLSSFLLVEIVYYINLLIPSKPTYPYFTVANTSVAEVNWDVGQIQPIYLLTFKKDNQTFYKVALRDASNKVKFIDLLVFTGNRSDSNSYGAFILINNNEVDLKKVDVGKLFKFGQKIEVSYLKNANNNYTISDNKGLCENSQNLCKAGEYTANIKDTRFSDLAKQIVSDKLDFLPVVSISLELKSK